MNWKLFITLNLDLMTNEIVWDGGMLTNGEAYMCYNVLRELNNCIKYNDRGRDKFTTLFSKLDVTNSFDITKCDQFKIVAPHLKKITQQFDYEATKYVRYTSFIVNLQPNGNVLLKYGI